MLILEHTVETTAEPERIWALWEDVENWNKWDEGLEFSTLDGPFQTGTTGRLKPRGGPILKTRLTCVESLSCFIDEAKMPLTKVVVTHALKREGNKTLVTHRIEMKGMLSWLFAILIGRGMKRNLPHEMNAMIRMAEK